MVAQLMAILGELALLLPILMALAPLYLAQGIPLDLAELAVLPIRPIMGLPEIRELELALAAVGPGGMVVTAEAEALAAAAAARRAETHQTLEGQAERVLFCFNSMELRRWHAFQELLIPYRLAQRQ
jgi:hypothetical protein